MSRKLTAWILATTLLFFDKLPAEHWATITMIYISAQGFIDTIKAYKFGE